MWSINGALALWIGYWIFVVWVVWTYEKKCRKLESENKQLRKLIEIRRGGNGARQSAKSSDLSGISVKK